MTRHITGTVRGTISIINDVGGTTCLPTGSYRVRVLDTFGDYETGNRCVGELLDRSDIQAARAAGTTGFKPKQYRKYGERHYRSALRAAKGFCPERVYFNGDSFVPDVGGPHPKAVGDHRTRCRRTAERPTERHSVEK